MVNIIKAGAVVEDDQHLLLVPIHRQLEVRAEPVTIVSYDAGVVTDVAMDTMASPDAEYVNHKLFERPQVEAMNALNSDFFEESKERAQREGYAQGVEDAKAKYDSLLVKVDGLMAAVEAAIPEYVRQNESVIAAIVFEAVSKILKVHLIDQQKSLDIVKEVIAEVGLHELKHIYISLHDFNSLKQLDEQVLSDGAHNDLKRLLHHFKPDPDMVMGGCRISMKNGTLDASLENQLSVLIKSLSDNVNESA